MKHIFYISHANWFSRPLEIIESVVIYIPPGSMAECARLYLNKASFKLITNIQ